MIRKDYDELTDVEFADIMEVATKRIKEYIDNGFLEEFIAKTISIKYEENALWNENSLKSIIQFGKEDLEEFLNFKVVDEKKVKKILEEKYKLKIINDLNIEIEEIK